MYYSCLPLKNITKDNNNNYRWSCIMRLFIHACCVLSGPLATCGKAQRTCMQLQTCAPSVFFKYSISIVTRQCYFCPGMLFARLKPYRSTDRIGPIAEIRTIFPPPPLFSPGSSECRLDVSRKGMRVKHARGRYRVTPFNAGYRFARARGIANARARVAKRSDPALVVRLH